MKTACEEAADALKNVYWLTSNPEVAERRADLDKRLRAEARELKRLRKAVVAHSSARTGDERYSAQAVIDREAARIQSLDIWRNAPNTRESGFRQNEISHGCIASAEAIRALKIPEAP